MKSSLVRAWAVFSSFIFPSGGWEAGVVCFWLFGCRDLLLLQLYRVKQHVPRVHDEKGLALAGPSFSRLCTMNLFNSDSLCRICFNSC